LIKNPGFLTFTDMRCGKMRSRRYFKNPARTVRVRRTLESLSDRHGADDIFELFMSPILSQTVYS
jgi:hypothetical protein